MRLDFSRLLAIASCLIAPVPHAAGQDEAGFLFNAYGTFGGVYSDEDNADFVGNLFQGEGAGHSATVSHAVDSRLGLQLTGRLDERLSAVVQVVVEQDASGDFAPRLEWANVQYEYSPDGNVRVGRMVQPNFMVSEYRKVGYAIPWVRPPEEVYRLIPVTNFDGIELSHRFRIGDFTHTLRAGYGRSDPDWAEGRVAGENILSLSGTLTRGPLTLFASLGRYDLDVDAFDPLFDAFERFGPAGEAIADRYRVDDDGVALLSFGGRYDTGDWFLMGEWAGSSTRSLLGELHGAYLTAGYRFGAWTPYVTAARAWAAKKQTSPGVPTANLPPPLGEAAAELNAGLQELLALPIEQGSLSIGTRWDLASAMALTLQYDYLNLRSDSAGLFTDLRPGFERGGSASVVSLTFDFVY